jgi:hypothetical protein
VGRLELLRKALTSATEGTSGEGDAVVAAWAALEATSDAEGDVSGVHLFAGYALLADALTRELARCLDITPATVLEHLGAWAARGGKGPVIPGL